MDELRDFAAQRHGVFDINDAREFGLTRKEILGRIDREWLRLFSGVYIIRGAPLTTRAILRAATLAGAPNAAASHRSAAWIYDVPGGRPQPAELTSPRWLRAKHPGLIVHESTRVEPGDVRVVDHITVMRPERVLIELASVFRSPDFIEMVLHAMRRKKILTFASMHATFDRMAGRGRPGIGIVRQVLDRWALNDRVTESPPETVLMQALRSAGLGRVVPQLEIRDHQGNFIARVDIGLPDLRATVEYDSDQEHGDEMSDALDNARRNKIMQGGWFPVVARKRDLKNGFVDVIAALRALRSKPA